MLVISTSDSRNDRSKWVVIAIEFVLSFIFAETVIGKRMQTFASNIPTFRILRMKTKIRPEKMTHRDLRRSMWFRGRREANDEDLFLEINDLCDSKQIYFHSLSNVNDVNWTFFSERTNLETMWAEVIHSSRIFITKQQTC